MFNFLFLLSSVDWLTLGYYTQIKALQETRLFCLSHNVKSKSKCPINPHISREDTSAHTVHELTRHSIMTACLTVHQSF